MKTLREVLSEARQNEIGVGHLNVSDLAGLKRSSNRPVHCTYPL